MAHRNKSRWRSYAAQVISSVIGKRNPRRMNADELKALRKEISAAYCYGARKYHPYKIWCSEVRNQLGVQDEGAKIPAGEGLFNA